MEWQDKIKEGMRLMSEGCYESFQAAGKCTNKCPFAKYCVMLEYDLVEKDLPSVWQWRFML